MNELSIVLPSRNNLKYLKWSYNSLRKNIGLDVNIILLDDSSTDGTWEWMTSIKKDDPNLQIYRNNGPERIGHCVLYDVGVEMSKTEFFMIFHADMYISKNALNNAWKYVQKNNVVSLTRVEPLLHPPGPEKESKNFGLEPETFMELDFEKFVEIKERENQNKLTKGFFAPWIMSKQDFFSIGGHDKRVFAPMELDDSDIGNRLLLKGYNLIQPRNSFVYHLTCRGSRFKDGIKIIQEIPVGEGNIWKRSQDSEEYTQLRQIKFREWWRKWHMDVLHDANLLPIVHPRYDTGFVVKNCPYGLIQYIEPWCDTLYIEFPEYIKNYIQQEQKISNFDIGKRIKLINDEKTNDVLIEFDGSQFNQNHIGLIKQLPLMIKDSGEIGIMEFDIFRLNIRRICSMEKNLIHADNPWYLKKLINL